MVTGIPCRVNKHLVAGRMVSVASYKMRPARYKVELASIVT